MADEDQQQQQQDQPEGQDQDQEEDPEARFFTRLDERLQKHSEGILDSYLARVSELLDQEDKTKGVKDQDQDEGGRSDAATQREAGRRGRSRGLLDHLYGTQQR